MCNYMVSLLLAGLLLTAAGCSSQKTTSTPMEPPVQEIQTDQESPPSQTGPIIDGDMALYTCGGIQIPLPVEYLDDLIVTVGEDWDPYGDLPEHRHSLMSLQERASVEALKKDFGSAEGGGFLFGITVMDQVGFQQDLQFNIGGCDIFAKDDTHYYAKTYPTDVQFYRSGGVIDSLSEDFQIWETLNELGDLVCADITEINGLTPYSSQEVWAQPFTWEGQHAYARYYNYYTFDGSKDTFYTFVLSQPATQGEGGIWCVERMYDEYENCYLSFPESDVPAAEYYAALQAECDAGQHPELLTPLGTAKAFVSDSIWFGDTATDKNVELTDRIDSDYSEANRAMSQVISSLLVQPETVDDITLLDCVGRFTNKTWGVMGRNFYGSDWWAPLSMALEKAAVGDDQMGRDRNMMRFYLVSYGQYAEFIAECLRTQQAADPEIFNEVLSEFPEWQQAILQDIVS